jgi:hypothetical protein
MRGIFNNIFVLVMVHTKISHAKIFVKEHTHSTQPIKLKTQCIRAKAELCVYTNFLLLEVKLRFTNNCLTLGKFHVLS